MKTHFDMKGFALNFALKQRLKAIRKEPTRVFQLSGKLAEVEVANFVGSLYNSHLRFIKEN